MTAANETIAVQQAADQVALAARRLGLLHLAFAETLVEELGDARGREVIVKAIGSYGKKIAAKAQQGVLEQNLPLAPENYDAGGPNWPSLGTADAVEVVEVEGEKRTRVHGCALAKVWAAHQGEALGRLYCLVDVAKMMGYNPAYKVIHVKAAPDGDAYCELVLRETTDQEREDWEHSRDWSYADTDDRICAG